MAIGIIYIMTTSIDGLIKIGKTKDRFEYRMAELESNGYKNVNGLKRYFAIRVKDYDEKEILIHKIFNKSQLGKSELFALDKDLAKEMLEAFEGEQIYPMPILSKSKPTKPIVNNLIQISKTSTKSSKQDFINFWTQFNNKIKSKKLSFPIRSNNYRYYFVYLDKRPKFEFNVEISTKLCRIKVGFIIRDPQLYNKLLQNKLAIEKDVDVANLVWEQDIGKMSHKEKDMINYYINNFDIKKVSAYSKVIDEILEVSVKMNKILNYI